MGGLEQWQERRERRELPRALTRHQVVHVRLGLGELHLICKMMNVVSTGEEKYSGHAKSKRLTHALAARCRGKR